METKQLTFQQRSRLGRWSLGLLPAALLLWHDTVIGAVHGEAVVSNVEVHSLSVDPWPLALTAARSGGDIVLHGTIQFANDCLAQTGFDSSYRDLSPLQLTGTRLVLLRGRRSPQGCPDIFAPVTRPLALHLAHAEEVRQILLLQEVAGRHPAVVVPSEPPATGARGEPVQAAGALRPLVKAEITSELDFRFQVNLPPGCSPRDVALEIIEGRGVTAARQSVTPVPLWVLVLTDGVACQSDARADAATDLAASLRSLILRDRRLYLVNPLLPPGAPEPRLLVPLAGE
jgi:hypothetical protein